MYNQSKDEKNLDVIKKDMTLRSDKKIKMKLAFTKLTKIDEVHITVS